MKKTLKKRSGFTIVELVIVIAVIAILAAVLIPTFASLTRRANLSADKQAVREMNMALAADEARNGKCENIDQAMRVLANAGYNTNNWQCLTSGYQVYWYKTDNRCVLYNSTTAEVEYPEEYDFSDIASNSTEFFLYNQNFYDALQYDFSLSSGGTSYSDEPLSSLNSTLSSAVSDNNALLASLGVGADETVTVKSHNRWTSSTAASGSYATVDAYVIDEGILTSSGAIVPNLYYISTEIADDATQQERTEAELAAGEYVYSLFTQMNTGNVSNGASIVIAPGTTINVSDREWKPVKTLTGYFGTTDDLNPIIIDGMNLTSATGYAETYTFAGSGSTYYMSGFIGAVYGTATIENLTFRNLEINRPASDYTITSGFGNSNCVGIIGGIVNTASNVEADVTIRNITVESSCEIIGNSRVGGLIGYIGGYQVGSNANKVGSNANKLEGSVTVEDCHVECDVTSLNTDSVQKAYGTAGGLLGFSTRTDGMTVTFNDCSYSGKVTGNNVGGIFAQVMMNPTITVNGCDTSDAELVNNAATAIAKSYIGTLNSAENTLVVDSDTLSNYSDGTDLIYAQGAAKYTLGDGEAQTATANTYIKK